MTDEFVCSKCRYYGEGYWSQCGACEMREQLAALERFKTLCHALLLALGPMGDERLVAHAALEARDFHRKHWGAIELCNPAAVAAVRARHREANV